MIMLATTSVPYPVCAVEVASQPGQADGHGRQAGGDDDVGADTGGHFCSGVERQCPW
jgi:hypothetical protein